MVKKLTAQKVFDKPIVTEVTAASKFYIAKDHHQNYFNNNRMKPYCTFMIQPKMHKFAKEFTDIIKPELF